MFQVSSCCGMKFAKSFMYLRSVTLSHIVTLSHSVGTPPHATHVILYVCRVRRHFMYTYVSTYVGCFVFCIGAYRVLRLCGCGSYQ